MKKAPKRRRRRRSHGVGTNQRAWKPFAVLTKQHQPLPPLLLSAYSDESFSCFKRLLLGCNDAAELTSTPPPPPLPSLPRRKTQQKRVSVLGGCCRVAPRRAVRNRVELQSVAKFNRVSSSYIEKETDVALAGWPDEPWKPNNSLGPSRSCPITWC